MTDEERERLDRWPGREELVRNAETTLWAGVRVSEMDRDDLLMVLGACWRRERELRFDLHQALAL